jgi:hypothetical protein
MRFCLRCAALASALLQSSALAASDPYGFGAGREPLILSGPPVNVNRAFATALSARAGESELTLSSAGAVAGDLLFLHQSSVARDGGATDLSETNAGRYCFRRASSVAGARVTLDEPLGIDLEAPGAQAVVVLETGDLTIAPDGGILAPPWDGEQGGVAVILVNGTLTNDGLISASGRGFRGAPDAFIAGVLHLCQSLENGTPEQGCAPRGEGFRGLGLGHAAGMGNDTTGGGGGLVQFGGGGGGAHGGRGGVGGTGNGPGLGGRGGEAVRYDLSDRLLFGGGGGAGHAPGGLAARGGNGGGIVYVRARDVRGAGFVSAEGFSGEPNDSGSLGLKRGAGGGGAGGAVALLLGEPGACQGVTVSGGGGGLFIRSECSSENQGGPGGGGAGGRALVAPWSPECLAAAPNGLAGHRTQCTRGTRGAMPDAVLPEYSGVVDVLMTPFVPPDAGSPGLPSGTRLRVGCGCVAGSHFGAFGAIGAALLFGLGRGRRQVRSGAVG